MTMGFRQGFLKDVPLRSKRIAEQDLKYKPQLGKEAPKQYSRSSLPFLAGGAYGMLAEEGITPLKTPKRFAGNVARMIVDDIGSAGTMREWWNRNHPSQSGDMLMDAQAGPTLNRYMPADRSLVNLATVGIPVAGTLGVLNLANPGEGFRPKGFAQDYSPIGTDDRRETEQPFLEGVQRLMGRRGQPLKYATAKEDIPDLTPERYANYMRYLYQDKGPTGLGLIKFTGENLEGKPEMLLGGFPIGLEAAGAIAGGVAAQKFFPGKTRIDTVPMVNNQPMGPSPRDVINTRETVIVNKKTGEEIPGLQQLRGRSPYKQAAIGLAGAVTGVLAGKMSNALIATGARNIGPNTDEYGVY